MACKSCNNRKVKKINVKIKKDKIPENKIPENKIPGNIKYYKITDILKFLAENINSIYSSNVSSESYKFYDSTITKFDITFYIKD